MSLKTRLRLSIAGLVTAVVLVMTALNLNRLAEVEFQDTFERAQTVSLVVENSLEQRINRQTAALARPATAEETADLWSSFVASDRQVSESLLKSVASSRVILEILISDAEGRVLASSDPSHAGHPAAALGSFEAWRSTPLWRQLSDVLFRRSNYEVVVQMGPAGQGRALFSIRVIVSSVLLRNAALPVLRDLVLFSLAALGASILLSVFGSNLVFLSLASVGLALDRIAGGDYGKGPPIAGLETRELSAIQSKLNLLGEKFRGARADVEQLRGNIEQLLQKLDEAVLLFDRGDRLIAASQAVEHLLGLERAQVMGRSVQDVFPPSTPLGAIIHGAMESREPVRDRLLAPNHSTAARFLVSVELLEDLPGHERAGILVTIRDAESRRQIQNQLDLATRLAAISRLTEGTAHEIKNPLNAIALHVEVLKSQLADTNPSAQNEIEVIAREIARLDRVVKTFLDFTRPVRPNIAATDAAALTREVAELVRPLATQNGVEVVVGVPAGECFLDGDRDLLQQALLNVVINGVEAMKQGGRLDLRLEREGDEWRWTIADQGGGIPAELRDRIFHLYTTTKNHGSGIGLAIAFRVVQLHDGTIDFTSEPGRGATFHLRFPAAGRQA
jgi:PAS domain S-box-containing protein